jgi:hypothetical protein
MPATKPKIAASRTLVDLITQGARQEKYTLITVPDYVVLGFVRERRPDAPATLISSLLADMRRDYRRERVLRWEHPSRRIEAARKADKAHAGKPGRRSRRR